METINNEAAYPQTTTSAAESLSRELSRQSRRYPQPFQEEEEVKIK